MAVRARFWVQKVTKQVTGAGANASGRIVRHVELAPVVRATGLPGADDNIDWSKYTPSGKIEMTISTDGAGEWFESMLGEDISITFDAAE